MPKPTRSLSVRSNALFTISFFFWIALLTLLSLISMEDMEIRGPEVPYLDKVLHMGFYLTAMVLGSLFLWERFRWRLKMGPSLLWMGAALAAYGMVIEVLQGMGGNARSAEWGDLAANILGIGLGGLFSRIVFRKVTALNWPD